MPSSDCWTGQCSGMCRCSNWRRHLPGKLMFVRGCVSPVSVGLSFEVLATNRVPRVRISTNSATNPVPRVRISTTILPSRVSQATDDLEQGRATVDEVGRIVRGQLTGCIASQCSEDMFNHCKNGYLIKGKRKFRRPEKSWATILARKVPERIHRYVPVEATEPVARTASLDKTVFEASQKSCSLDVASLAGTSQSPTWYTAGPEQVSRVHADLELFRAASHYKAYRQVAENAWLGELLDWNHQLVIRPKGSDDDDAWLLALHHWADSAALVWPCRRLRFHDGTNELWFDLHDDGEPRLLAFCSVEDWEATTFDFRSPSWQQMRCQPPAAGMPPAVRRVQRFAPMPVLEVAARCGWWRLGKVFLSNLAKHVGCELPPASTIFEATVRLTDHVLKCDRSESLRHLQRRLADDDASSAFCADLLEVDDVSHVLTREDEDAFKKTKKTAETFLTETKAFRAEFHVASMAEAAKKAKDGKKRAKKTPASDLHLRLDSEVSQAEAISFCPPGGAIWRDRVDGAWCSHYAPFKRFSRSWRRYGECEALRLCLSDMWQKHCLVMGTPLSDCPLKGLLEHEPALQASQASGSAGPASSARSSRG